MIYIKYLLFTEEIQVNASYYADMIAQATCGGLSETEGWVFAVRRPCVGDGTCEQICEADDLKAQDINANATMYVLIIPMLL